MDEIKEIIRKILSERGVERTTRWGRNSHHYTSYKYGDFFIEKVNGYEDDNLCAYGISVKYHDQQVCSFDNPNNDDFERGDWTDQLRHLVENGIPEMDQATRDELQDPDYGKISLRNLPIDNFFAPIEDYQIGDSTRQAIEGLQADLQAAEEGNADAQCNLGIRYNRDGVYGVAQDYETAARWFRLSAAQGNAQAQHYLGYYYENGLGGVGQDYAIATQWFHRAAAQGFILAQRALGDYYQDGRAGITDRAEALKWYTLACEQDSHPWDHCHARRHLLQQMTQEEIDEAEHRVRQFKHQQRGEHT